MKTRTTILLIGLLVLTAAGLSVREEQLHHRLRTENTALRQRTNQISELEDLRSENQRLNSLLEENNEFERLGLERGELRTLREEAARLQSESVQRAERAIKSVSSRVLTNNPWPVGQTLARADWVDAGQDSPSEVLKTYLWAIFSGDAQRLRECVQFPISNTTNDYFAWEIQYCQRYWKSAQSVRMLSESRGQPDRGELQFEIITPIPEKDAKTKNGQQPEPYREKHTWECFRDGERWKLNLLPPPKTTIITFSADPEERARQTAELPLPAEILEMFKKVPAGKEVWFFGGAHQ